MGKRVADLVGQRFGRLVVITRTRHPIKQWLCRCDCSQFVMIVNARLLNGWVKSCGCLLRKHGLKKNPIWGVYKGMMARCYKPNVTGYERWGGRGIKVCDRWRESITNFHADMGDRPSLAHSIDRIDPLGDYCPENCRWALPTEQARNRKTTLLTAVEVVQIRYLYARFGFTKQELAKAYGVLAVSISGIVHRHIWKDIP